MHPIQNAGGHVGVTAREYPIAAATDIKRGQVVKLSGGYVTLAAAGETSAVLGIAAENHRGVEDALDERANGNVVKVYDNPELIFECPAPSFAATGGTAGTVTAADTAVACAAADKFNGGRLMLVKKAAGSANTDAVGDVRKITDYALASNVATFTLDAAGTAGSGDEYCVFPPIGAAAWGSLDAERKGMVLTAAACSKLRVVGWDMDRRMLRLMAVEHSLGVEN